MFGCLVPSALVHLAIGTDQSAGLDQSLSLFMMNRNFAEKITLKAAVDTEPSSAHTYAATVPLDRC